MKESHKTLIFVFTAVIMTIFAAVVSLPGKQKNSVDDMVGKELFLELTDALDVSSLEIVRYDETKAEITPFEVRRVNHLWTLPSHENYPADAKDQVVRAATSLMGLRVISVVGENASVHADFGVITPDPKSLRVGTIGVGQRVVMKDETGKVLLDLIIGKEVHLDAEKRYVRRAGQDPVYTVELSTEQLSTNFSDWIERDLMRIQPWDITALNALDYSLEIAAEQQTWNGIMKLTYDDMRDHPWKLAGYQTPMGLSGEMRERGMPAGMRLNTEKLDNCRNALADMRIVNVARKPEALSADLKVMGNYHFGEEAVKSLQDKGFFPFRIPVGPGQVEEAILSNEGEISVTTKTGICYLLRFGNVAGTGAASQDADSPLGLNRYLLIVAQLAAEAIPEPHLHELPKIPAEVSQEEKTRLEAERAAVEAANQEELAEYETAVAEAKTRVDALNERFAQWYYVIPESVYQEIRLSYQTIFTDEKAEDDGEDDDHDHIHGHAHDEEHVGGQKISESEIPEAADSETVLETSENEESESPAEETENAGVKNTESGAFSPSPPTDIFAGAAGRSVSDMVEEDEESELAAGTGAEQSEAERPDSGDE